MRELPNRCYSDTTSEERWQIYLAVQEAMIAKAKEMFGTRCSFSNPNCDVYRGLKDELLQPEEQKKLREGRGQWPNYLKVSQRQPRN
jgi:hypothetical protein